MYLFFYMALGLNDFDAGKSITQDIGIDGPRKYQLFWAQMALASSQFSGPTASKYGPRNVFFRIEIITSRAI
jgi:hypothetical protein